MLHEQAVVRDSIEWFLDLDYPRDLFRICLVTTAQETCDTGETTAEMVERLFKNDLGGRMLHLHVGGKNKATQLNRALELLRDELHFIGLENSLIGVYDADSRPDKGVLREVDRERNVHPEAVAFQQPAAYFNNLSELPGGIWGAYLRSRPLYNLRFCLFRELPAYFRSRWIGRNRVVRLLAASPNHFLGHGEFIRASFLAGPNPFPEPSADTSLGTRLSLQGFQIAPLRTFDTAETPRKVRTLFWQGIVWHQGGALIFRDLRDSLKDGVRIRGWHLSLVLKRLLENYIWAFGPLTYCIGLALGVAWGARRRRSQAPRLGRHRRAHLHRPHRSRGQDGLLRGIAGGTGKRNRRAAAANQPAGSRHGYSDGDHHA